MGFAVVGVVWASAREVAVPMSNDTAASVTARAANRLDNLMVGILGRLGARLLYWLPAMLSDRATAIT
jgi:mannose/fructose/N-acetylgalactosamine-specific phosphotransferase system component IID